MKSASFIISCFLFLLILPIAALSQQQDNPDCKDYTGISKVQGTWLLDCNQKESFAYKFLVAEDEKLEVEGRYFAIYYYPITNYRPAPDEIRVLRHYENAVVKMGGKLVYRERRKETLTYTLNGSEVWVEVRADGSGKYSLTVVEKSSMAH